MKREVRAALGGIGSLAMIFYAVHLFKCITEATGWSAVGFFLLGSILLGAGLGLFCKVDKTMSKL